jgi:hypothetical protein
MDVLPPARRPVAELMAQLSSNGEANHNGPANVQFRTVRKQPKETRPSRLLPTNAMQSI